MPAYMKARPMYCDNPICHKRATQEVFDAWNGPRGIFCVKHANALVKYLNEPDKPVEKSNGS